MTDDFDFYDLLEIDEDASQEEVKDAFRTKVREYHPDLNDDPDAPAQFTAVKKGYEILKDPSERQAYDRLGHKDYVAKRTSGIPDPSAWRTDDGGSASAGGTGASATGGTSTGGGSSGSGGRTRSSGSRGSRSSSSSRSASSAGSSSRSSSGDGSSSRSNRRSSRSSDSSSGRSRRGSRAGSSDSGGGSSSRSNRRSSSSGTSNASRDSNAATSSTSSATGSSNRRARSGSSTSSGGGATPSGAAAGTGGATRDDSTVATGSGTASSWTDNPLFDWWRGLTLGLPLMLASTLLFVAGVGYWVAANRGAFRSFANALLAAGTDVTALQAALTTRNGVPTLYAFVDSTTLVEPMLPTLQWYGVLAGSVLATALAFGVYRAVWADRPLKWVTTNETVGVGVVTAVAATVYGGPLLAGAIVMPFVFLVVVRHTPSMSAASYAYVLGVTAPLAVVGVEYVRPSPPFAVDLAAAVLPVLTVLVLLFSVYVRPKLFG